MGPRVYLQSNREREAAGGAERYLFLPALRNGCQPVIREGKGTCENFRLQSPELGSERALITGR